MRTSQLPPLTNIEIDEVVAFIGKNLVDKVPAMKEYNSHTGLHDPIDAGLRLRDNIKRFLNDGKEALKQKS